jgi:hypothetical protein
MYGGAKLGIFLKDEPRGSRTFAKTTITIGEDSDSDICFDDAGLEYDHARIQLLSKGAFVESDDYDPETRVNGRPIRSATKLAAGDQITAGDVRIVVEELIPEGVKIEIPPRYCSVKILDQCPHCGSGLPVNGVLRTIPCASCQKEVTFQDRYWRVMLEDLDDDFEQGGGNYTINMTTSVRWKAERPRCVKCDGELPVDDIPVGSDSDVFCPGCGARNATCPAPEYARAVLPSLSQIYCGERPGGSAGKEALQPGEGPRPVILSCPQCAAALKVGADAERTVTCQFCSADVYLPDDLWLRLHPAKTTSVWYVRFDGKRPKELKEEQERPRREAEVVARMEEQKKVRRGSMIGWLIPVAAVGIPIAVVLSSVLGSGSGPGWVPEALDAGAGSIGEVAFSIAKPVSFAPRTDGYSVVWAPSPDSPAWVHVAWAPHFPGTVEEAISLLQAQYKTGMEVAGLGPVPGGFQAVLRDPAGRSAEVQVFRRKEAAGPGLLCTAHVGVPEGRLDDVDELVSYLGGICGSLAIR